MAVVYLDEGLTECLQRRNGVSQMPIDSMRLYTNNYAPTKASVKADFTEVGIVMAYIAKAIISGDWGYTLDTVGHKVTAVVMKNWTFTAGAGLTIYGWYITNQGNTKAVMAEKFTTAVVIPAAGGTLAITLNDTFRDCN